MTEGNKPNNDTKERKPLNDLDALNQKYYEIFQELKDASPALANCDAAFLSFVQNITEWYQSDSKHIRAQFLNKEDDANKSFERIEKFSALCERFYFMGERLKANKEKLPEELFALIKCDMENEYQKLYELFAGEYDPEMDRKIAEQRALHDRIVPDRNLWRRFLFIFKKRTQNHAADLVDLEANEKAAKDFAEKEAQIILRRAERYGADELAMGFREKFNTYIEEQLAKEEKSEESEGEEEEIECIIDENPEECEENTSKTASVSDSEREGDKNDGEKVEVLAENAPESVSEGAKQAESEEASNLPKKKRAKRRKEKKGEEENARLGT